MRLKVTTMNFTHCLVEGPTPIHTSLQVPSKKHLTSTNGLGLVDKGEYLEVKSRTAKCAINKRNRLKLHFIQNLGVAQNEEMQRKAVLKYMITTGSTNTRIMAKGRKKMAREKKE